MVVAQNVGDKVYVSSLMSCNITALVHSVICNITEAAAAVVSGVLTAS